MKSRHLRELHNLFKHDGDAIALLYLADGVAAAGGHPLRFREMAKEINQSSEYVPESSLQRCVQRLEVGGLIDVDRTDIRHPLYQPTTAGRRMAALLTFILDSFDHNHEDPPTEPE
ncbi:MAG: hypothetical protein HKP61_13405 [Dactylosporangium sp.]|nr:hypothetical protein [Dactylosporangium sp.]NNJ61912.1 hypothetical protein [Dactylosporangium sp.]